MSFPGMMLALYITDDRTCVGIGGETFIFVQHFLELGMSLDPWQGFHPLGHHCNSFSGNLKRNY